MLCGRPHWGAFGERIKMFQDIRNPNTYCFVCSHILNKERQISFIHHDSDGDWQFLCDKKHEIKDIKVLSISEITDLDKTLELCPKLDYGQSAEKMN